MGAALCNAKGEDSYKIKLNDDNFIGEGSYAQVYKIIRKKDELVCAAKIFNVPLALMNKKEETGYKREIEILKKSNHPFII